VGEPAAHALAICSELARHGSESTGVSDIGGTPSPADITGVIIAIITFGTFFATIDESSPLASLPLLHTAAPTPHTYGAGSDSFHRLVPFASLVTTATTTATATATATAITIRTNANVCVHFATIVSQC
jgi:hypothetical protein